MQKLVDIQDLAKLIDEAYNLGYDTGKAGGFIDEEKEIRVKKDKILGERVQKLLHPTTKE